MTLLRLILLSFLLFSATTALAAPPSEVRRACMTDAKRLCSSVLLKPSARQACMRKNRAKWSPGCRQAVDKWRGSARAKCLARYAGPQARDCVRRQMGLPRRG
jgi:hypothetical protein